jgi:hypothetical protein
VASAGVVAWVPLVRALGAAPDRCWFDHVGARHGREVDVLRAHHRQLAHAHAGLIAALMEVARTTAWYEPPAGPSAATPDAEQPDEPPVVWLTRAQRAVAVLESAEGEIAAALRWTPGKAGWELARAQTLVNELPSVYAALTAGRIDRPKADVFAEYLNPEHTRLTRAQIDRLITRFLPQQRSGRGASWPPGCCAPSWPSTPKPRATATARPYANAG